LDKALEELGKQLLNIGVAVIVFVIIQPFASQSIDTSLVIKGIIAYLLITGGGLILLWKSRQLEEREDG